MSAHTPMTWQAALQDYACHMADTGAAASSAAKHARTVARFAAETLAQSPMQATAADVLEWLAAADVTPATWRSRRASLRHFYRWALAAGHIAANPVPDVPERRPLVLAPPRRAAGRPHGPKRLPVPESWRMPLARFDRLQVLSARPVTTRTTYRQTLEHFARFAGCGPFDVSGETLAAYLAGGDIARETLRLRRNVLVSFYRWAVDDGHMSASPAAGLPKVASMPGLPRPIPEPPLTAALARADETQTLVLRLAADAGLRRAEIAAVHSSDVLHTLDGYALLVHGKGERERLVPLPDELADALLRRPAGYLLPTRTGGHFDPRRVSKLVRPLLPEAYTLHTLRHRFATAAYRFSHDLYAVQTLLGHASPATTQRYVGLDTENLRSVIDAVAALRTPPA